MMDLTEGFADRHVDPQLFLELAVQAVLEGFARTAFASRELPQAAQQLTGRTAGDEDVAVATEHPDRGGAAGDGRPPFPDRALTFDAGASRSTPA